VKKNVLNINTRDMVFNDVFQQVPQNLTLPHSNGGFLLTHRTNTTSEPLITFSDGTSFIVKYRYGNGLVYFSAVPLDKSYTDLPLNPIFAPMVYKIAISRESVPMNAFVIGKNNQAIVPADLAKGEEVLRLKGAGQEFIPSQRLIGTELLVQLNNEISSSGYLCSCYT
jgi:hypothetical protein